MSVTLPDDVAWVLNLLGFMWPEADEDKLRASAQSWRDFGSHLARIHQDSRSTAAQVTAENHGDSIDAFERYWQGIGGAGGDFDRAAEAADHMATALDAMATLVEGVKVAVIAQVTLLAAEIVADQIAAPETFGLSEGVAAGEIIVTRGIVRRLIQEGVHRVGREIVQQLKGRALELLRKILATALRRAVTGAVLAGAADAGKQELDINVFHSRKGFDLGELGAATGSGAVLGAVMPRVRPPHGPGSRFMNPVEDGRLPAYTKKVGTRGTLHIGGAAPLALKSGEKGPSMQVRGKGINGFNGNQLLHVEGHAAAQMRVTGAAAGDLEINRVPCTKGSGGGCDGLLPKMLPEGAKLRVYGPDGFYREYVGLPDR